MFYNLKGFYMKELGRVGGLVFLTYGLPSCSVLSECPEEAYDPRSLYERLQEQREKKQQEFEEQFKFSKHQQQTACVVCNSCAQLLSEGHICVSCLPLWEGNKGFRALLLQSWVFKEHFLGTEAALHTCKTQKVFAVIKLHACKVLNTELILYIK